MRTRLDFPHDSAVTFRKIQRGRQDFTADSCGKWRSSRYVCTYIAMYSASTYTRSTRPSLAASNDLKLSKRRLVRSQCSNDKMADQWREPLSGSVTARMLLQQPIPVFDRVRKLAHSSADFFEILGASAHAALTTRKLPR